MATIKVIVLILCLISTNTLGQQTQKKNWFTLPKSKSDTVPDSSRHNYFTFGTDYSNRVLFWGRDFGERQWGTSPYLIFNLPIGLYAFAQTDFWSKNPHKPARNVFGVGYEAQLSKMVGLQIGYERWYNHYGDKYFNNALKNEVEAALEIKAGKFSIEPSFYYFFGMEKIAEADISLSRSIRILNKKLKLFAIPACLATFANPAFSYIYGFTDPNYNYGKFRLVDLETSTSVMLRWRNLELIGAMRFNAPIKIANEKISPFHYYTLELNYNF